MENVTLVRDGAIATVTLNRPDRRNSLSDAMLTDLGAAFVELRDDTTTRHQSLAKALLIAYSLPSTIELR